MMKKKIAVSALIIVMAAGTMAFTFGGRSPEGRRFKAPLHALRSPISRPADPHPT